MAATDPKRSFRAYKIGSVLPFRLEVFLPLSGCECASVRSNVGYSDFLRAFEGNDWSTLAQQVPWARNGWPGLAVVSEHNGMRLWIAAYDWTIDFGYSGPTARRDTTGYIIGLTDLPLDGSISYISGGVEFSESDFLIMEKDIVEYLVQLFFDGKHDDVIRMLLEYRPVNRFSEGHKK